ncbi:DUF4303 domain-containing protein [Paenibacillus sp. strain BS8-2]
MSSYDVHIGKLISEKRELEGNGIYLICTPEKEILEVSTHRPENGVFISSKDIEDALYDFCRSAIEDYILEGNNKDVYTFSIYTDTYYGSYVIYINNMASLNQSVDENYASYQNKYLETGYEHYNQSREQLYNQYKYGEGDYHFMYEEMPERLEKWLNIFSRISQEEPEYLDIDQNYIFEKTIVDSQLFLIAIDVIHRLQDDLKQLDQTSDFIAYVSAADGVGGNLLTDSQLIRRCVSEDQMYRAIPQMKDKDMVYMSVVAAVKQKALHEQVQHWINVIEEGEFGKDNIRSFWKTDYEAYEPLVVLGQMAVPYIQENMNRDLKAETKYILEMVLADLKN